MTRIIQAGKCPHLNCLVFHGDAECNCNMRDYCGICSHEDLLKDKSYYASDEVRSTNIPPMHIRNNKSQGTSKADMKYTIDNHEHKYELDTDQVKLEEVCVLCGISRNTIEYIASQNTKSEEINEQVTKNEEMDWTEEFDKRFNKEVVVFGDYLFEDLKDFIHTAIHQAIAQDRERIAEEYKNRRATIKWLWNKENTDEGKLGMVLKQLNFLSEVITNNHE